MGAKKETFFGLSGLGDLVLTATSLKSRNTKLGNQIGISDGLKNTSKDLTEGFYTTNAVYNISKKKKIKLPIIDAVYNILYNNGSVDSEIGLLMNRPLRDENTTDKLWQYWLLNLNRIPHGPGMTELTSSKG